MYARVARPRFGGSAAKSRRHASVALLVAVGLMLALPANSLGATWGEPVPVLTNGPAEATGMVGLGASTAAVAFDVFSGEFETDIWVNTSNDAGTFWGQPVRIATGACCAEIAGFGKRVDVVWADAGPFDDAATTLYYRRSSDRGRSFAPRVVLTDNTQLPFDAAIGRFSAGHGPDGLVGVLWEAVEHCFKEVDGCVDRTSYQVRISTNNGATFGPVRTIATVVGDNEETWAGLAIGGGVAYLAFVAKDLSLRLKRSVDAGVSWSAAKILASAVQVDAFFPSLAITANGTHAAVSYAEWRGRRTRALMVRATSNGGHSWASPTSLSEVRGRQILDTRLTWQGGTLRAAFTRCALDCLFPNDLKMFYRASPDGVTWTRTQKVLDFVRPEEIGFAGQVMILYNDGGPRLIRGSAH